MANKIVLVVLVAAVEVTSLRADANCSAQCDIYHCNDSCWDDQENHWTVCRKWDYIIDSQCDSFPPSCHWQASNRQLQSREYQGYNYELPGLGWYCGYNVWYMNWERWTCPNWEERCSFQDLEFQWWGPIESPEQCGDWQYGPAYPAC